MRAERPRVLVALGEWMRRNELAAMGCCRSWEIVPARAWRRTMQSRVRLSGVLRLLEAYEWTRAGPAWGKIERGVAHTDKGKVAALTRYMIQGNNLHRQLWYPIITYRSMKKQIEGYLLKCPEVLAYLGRYGWLAAREWTRLAKVAQRMELERLEGLRREHEAREAARSRGEAVVSDEDAGG